MEYRIIRQAIRGTIYIARALKEKVKKRKINGSNNKKQIAGLIGEIFRENKDWLGRWLVNFWCYQRRLVFKKLSGLNIQYNNSKNRDHVAHGVKKESDIISKLCRNRFIYLVEKVSHFSI